MSSNTVPVNTNTTMSSTTGVVATVVVALFLFALVTLILYVRAKRYPGRIFVLGGRSRFAPNSAAATPTPLRLPLDPTVLDSLPVTVVVVVFRSQGDLEPEGPGPVDCCAVCLSEFTGGEAVRFLPECGHGFHVGCIDVWFGSDSTCPLCRLPVGPTSTTYTSSSSSSGRLEQGVVAKEIPSASASTSCAAGGDRAQVSGAMQGEDVMILSKE